jgi:hypothetical protein
VVLLTALSAYGGPRYRSPFEPVLYVYLGIVLAGEWARASRGAVALAGVLSVLALVLVW